MSALALSPDGGSYALLPSPDAETRMHMLLQRRDAQGTIVPGWDGPEAEVAIMDPLEMRTILPTIVPDGRGGVLFIRRFTTADGPSNLSAISRPGLVIVQLTQGELRASRKLIIAR